MPLMATLERSGRTGPADVLVRRFSALYPLQPQEGAAIAPLVTRVTNIPTHHEILAEGRPAREAVVLLSGMACHHRIFNDARRQMTGFVLPGDLCDYGFLSSSPVRQSVISLGPAMVGYIDLAQLSSLADKMPNIVVAAMRAAFIDQASARELVISLGVRDAMQRLAHFLSELHYRLKQVDLVSVSGQFPLPMTQAELGEALGLSTVHVNRTVQQLRKKKLITMSQGQVTILDQQALADLAEFDVRYLRPS